MVKAFYPNTKVEMPRYKQFQDVHIIRNPNILKYWLNTNQIDVSQLSSEQKKDLGVRPPEERPSDMTMGEVNKKD